MKGATGCWISAMQIICAYLALVSNKPNPAEVGLGNLQTKIHKIDYILVSKKLMSNVQNGRAFPSVDCGSDHHLVMANIKLKLKVKTAIKKVKQIDVGKLLDDVTKREFCTAVDKEWQEMLSHSTDDVEVFWKRFKVAIRETSKKVLGFKTVQECRKLLLDATLELMTQRRLYKSRRKEHPDMAKHHNIIFAAMYQRNMPRYGYCKGTE